MRHGESDAASHGGPLAFPPGRSAVSAAAGVAIEMTQQYLAGELSALLAEFQATVRDRAAAGAAARLRADAETLPIAALAPVATRALDLVNAACWASVASGDTAAFDRQAAVAAQLYDFGVCAGLLTER